MGGLAPTIGMMRPYRCYFWTDHEHVAKARDCECPDDAAARAWAEQLLVENRAYRIVEIWDRERLVERRQRVV